MRTRLTLALSAAIVAAPLPALAWGNEGHEVVALIARSYLAPSVLARVDQLLAEDGDTLTAQDMASRATWADKWRAADRSTAPWHYTDLQLGRPDLAEACGSRRSCAPDKVTEFASELASRRTPEAERIFALKMVLHLVGDMHQPLHSATAAAGGRDDAGGNCERVSVFGLFGPRRTMSLHAYWDDATVEALGSNPKSIASNLREQITAAEVLTWSKGTPASWTMESYGLAEQVAYRFGGPVRCASTIAPLDAAYQQRAVQTASLQLRRAGVRLATVLNRSIGGTLTPSM